MYEGYWIELLLGAIVAAQLVYHCIKVKKTKA